MTLPHMAHVGMRTGRDSKREREIEHGSLLLLALLFYIRMSPSLEFYAWKDRLIDVRTTLNEVT